MILYVVLLVLALFLIEKWIQGKRLIRLTADIPGPKTLPIIGNGLDLTRGAAPLFSFARELANTYRNISKVQVFGLVGINLYDPEDVEILLSSQKHITKGGIYKLVHPWLKDGLLTTTGEKWQKRRKILTPAFHFNILRQFCNIFIEHSNIMVNDVRSKEEDSETEILPLITDYTLNSISETAMGTNLVSVQSSVAEYKKAVYDFGVSLVERFTNRWFIPPGIYELTLHGRKQERVIKTLHSFTTNVINDRRNERNLTGNKFEVNKMADGDYFGSKKSLAMLDLLLTAEAEGNIDEMGIREEVDTFMFEGHDTTTLGLLYCMMLLANHQDAQQLIVEELDEIFKDDDTVNVEKLNKMNYLERCIKESLRLYPSVPFISRQLQEDLQLKNYLIPAGASCNIHIFDMHRNPETFPNPDRFDPDRFLAENTVNRHPYAFIPFSAGPRNCIGQKFAILEEKAVLSAILRNFKLEAVTRPEDIIFIADIVLRCRNPIKIKFTPRTKSAI